MSSFSKKAALTGAALCSVGAMLVGTASPAQAYYDEKVPACITGSTSTVPGYVYLYNGCGSSVGTAQVQWKLKCRAQHPEVTLLKRGESEVWGSGNLPPNCGVKLWIWKTK